MDLSGKVALVTGASRGIGREISRQLAEHGARIAVYFKGNEEAARETLTSLAGGPHVLFRADVADPGSARDLVNSVVEEMGAVNVLVNNAGIFEHTRFRARATRPGRTPGTERSPRTSSAPRTYPSASPTT
jgi:3-oxoacyl-[acyl-carrier protein] reductase